MLSQSIRVMDSVDRSLIRALPVSHWEEQEPVEFE